MHLNPQHPNILHDMQAAANGKLLRSMFSKRHLIPRKTYPYASERQIIRQQVNYGKVLMKRIVKGHKSYYKAETQG